MDIKRVREIHPCFGAKQNRGRIHLPVCPGCNMECRFCDRKINETENRPGVTGSIIQPEQAIHYIERALKFCPELSVVGIAGPGDSLVTDNAIKTFRLVGKTFPHLLKCMSTNGLLLQERADELIDIGLDTLTVTVNAVDPKIQAKIINGLIYHKKRYSGEEAGRILIQNQLAGIQKMASAGVLIKVNTVLVNEINRDHIKSVAKKVKEAGASIYNIIPLIPQHDLKNCEVPTCADIEGVRWEAGKYIDVFRHCQHCRADAVGIPGCNNFSQEVYRGEIQVKETFSHG